MAFTEASFSLEANPTRLNDLYLYEITEADIEKKPAEVFNSMLNIGRNLLIPSASSLDVMTLWGYVLPDLYSSKLHNKAKVELVSRKGLEESIGCVVSWSGHEQFRRHIYLPNEEAFEYMNSLAAQSGAEKIDLAVLMRDDSTLVKEGFTREQLDDTPLPGRKLKPDDLGQKILTYYRMPLVKSMFYNRKNKPAIDIQLPINPKDFSEREILLPQAVIERLPHWLIEKRLTVRRVSIFDLPQLLPLHKKNNIHASLNIIDMEAPNYAIFADGEPIAQAGYEADIILEVNGKLVPLLVAANLVVDDEWGNSGIGGSLSYSAKDVAFKLNEDSIIITDNVERTRGIWERKYGSHIVCRTGWLAYVKKQE